MLENEFEIKIEENKSLIYFLPILNNELNLKFLYLLKNSYFFNDESEKEFPILYQFNGEKEFLKFEDNLFEHELFIGFEDYDEYVLYKFKIPEEYLDDLKLIKEGSWNKLDYFKQQNIEKFARRRLLKNIDEIRKSMGFRVDSIPIDMEKETFTNSLVKKKKLLNANDLFKPKKNE